MPAVDEYGFTGSIEEHSAAAKIQTSFRKRQAEGTAMVKEEVDSEQIAEVVDVASASADVSSDHVRLYKALGGGWTPGGVSRVPIVTTQYTESP